MAPAALALFLIMLGALYWLTRREDAQYDRLEEVMERKSDPEPAEAINSIWSGDVNGERVDILRGEDIRDSNRSITLRIEAGVPVRFRLDPSNPLRRMSRWLEELMGNHGRVEFEGPLSSMIGYGERPEEIRQFLRPWDDQRPVDRLKQFHHVRGTDTALEARFYQTEIDQEDIRNRAEEFVELCNLLDLSPAEP